MKKKKNSAKIPLYAATQRETSKDSKYRIPATELRAQLHVAVVEVPGAFGKQLRQIIAKCERYAMLNSGLREDIGGLSFAAYWSQRISIALLRGELRMRNILGLRSMTHPAAAAGSRLAAQDGAMPMSLGPASSSQPASQPASPLAPSSPASPRTPTSQATSRVTFNLSRQSPTMPSMTSRPLRGLISSDRPPGVSQSGLSGGSLSNTKSQVGGSVSGPTDVYLSQSRLSGLSGLT